MSRRVISFVAFPVAFATLDDADRQACLAAVQKYRPDMQLCAASYNDHADEEATYDATHGAHAYVKNIGWQGTCKSNGPGQCACPNYGAKFDWDFCTGQYFAEGPGGGHYDIMMNSKSQCVACGHDVSTNTMTHNFCGSDSSGPAPSPSPAPSPGPSWYKTITPTSNTNLCLDLPGDSAESGNLLWLWECNGQESQRWVFDNYQIRFGADESKCIDAGDMSNGLQLFLWECNGQPQQTWGYNSDASTVYLADTNICLDYYGDQESSGQPLHVWECTEDWNQQWSVWDASTLSVV